MGRRQGSRRNPSFREGRDGSGGQQRVGSASGMLDLDLGYQEWVSQQQASKLAAVEEEGLLRSESSGSRLPPPYPSLSGRASEPGLPRGASMGRRPGVSFGGNTILELDAPLTSRTDDDSDSATGSYTVSASSARLTGALAQARAKRDAAAVALHAEAEAQKLQPLRLFHLHEAWARLFKQQRRSKAGLFFTVPVLLLSLRVGIARIVTRLHPMWTDKPQGKEALAKMDATICELFDPQGYIRSGLSVMESSPAAIALLHRFKHKTHIGERHHFNDTSNLVRLTMKSAQAPQARRLLNAAAATAAARAAPNSSASVAAAPRTSASAGCGASSRAQPQPQHRPSGSSRAATELAEGQKEQLFNALQNLQVQKDPVLYPPRTQTFRL